MPKNINGETYFTIGEVAKEVGISIQTIKRWEMVGKIPCACRLESNKWRVFSTEQVSKITKYANKMKDQ